MFMPDKGWNSGYIHVLLDELSTGEPEQAALCLFYNLHTPAESFSGRVCHLLQKQKLMILPQITSSDNQYLFVLLELFECTNSTSAQIKDLTVIYTT